MMIKGIRMLREDRYNKNKEGTIFDIQRFSINDGPGIRTIVFLKGCPLKCKWCSNPESQSKDIQITFNKSSCINCGKCIDVCPQGAISLDGNNKIDRDKCDNCGLCVDNCYSNALVKIGRKIKVEELLQELKKDSLHFRRSGGGVTLSGGELLGQADFVAEILKGCKSMGWHTTLETTAFAKKEAVEKVIPLADLVLLDIKHTNNDIHINHIGVGNKIILENAKHISMISKELIIRVPVIPHFNCDNESINAIASFVKTLENVIRVDLLAYHNLGSSKYQNLEMKYEMDSDIAIPTENIMNEFKEVFESFDMKCVIEG